MVLIMLAVWVVAFLGFADRHGPRHAAIAAFTVVTVLVLGSAEGLSVGRWVRTPWLQLVWVIALGITMLVARPSLRGGVRRVLNEWDVRRLGAEAWVGALLLVLMAIGTLASAVLYPAVNYDSLTAHMPRVFFWLQRGTVAPYPTPFGPQIFSGDLVSYFAVHFQLLTGSDHLASLTQWFSYVLSIVTVSLIARELGALARGQRIAAIAAAATPMALLQASTMQTDLTMSLWCLVAVYSLLAARRTADVTTRSLAWWAIWAGTAIGLAAQSKASAYLVVAPFLVVGLLSLARNLGWRRVSALAGAAALCVLAINAGHFARNAQLFGLDVIGSRAPGMAHILVTDMSPKAVATNGLKNASMLLGTPSSAVNRTIALVVRRTVAMYGGRIENPSNQEGPSGAYHLDGRITNHDVGPAPLIVLLVLVALGVVIYAAVAQGGDGSPNSRSGPQPAPIFVLGYAACGVTALALVAGLVSWNLFVSRVLLGPLLLLLPVVGYVDSLLERNRRRAGSAVLAVVLVASVAWGVFVLAFNSTNRLISPSLVPALPFARDVGYWNTSFDALRCAVLIPHLDAPFERTAAIISASHARRVGIDDRIGGFAIYPLLFRLRHHEVGYVRDIVLPEHFADQVIQPDLIVTIMTAEEYADAGGHLATNLLAPPIVVGSDAVILVERARDRVGAM